jgi:hypothetical protein
MGKYEHIILDVCKHTLVERWSMYQGWVVVLLGLLGPTILGLSHTDSHQNIECQFHKHYKLDGISWKIFKCHHLGQILWQVNWKRSFLGDHYIVCKIYKSNLIWTLFERLCISVELLFSQALLPPFYLSFFNNIYHIQHNY